MHFQIEKSDFSRLLRDASLVAPKKSPKAICTCLLIEADTASKHLRVTANDGGEQVFSSKVAANVHRAGQVAIKAVDITQVVKSLPVGIIEVSLGEAPLPLQGDSEETPQLDLDEDRSLPLVLKGGKAKISLETLPASEFPQSDWTSEDTIPAQMGAGDILRLIGRTAYAVSLEETRYYLGGCHFELEDGDLVVTATDGHRLAQARTAWSEATTLICGGPGKAGAILPRSLVTNLAKLLHDNRALGAEFQIIRGKVAWFESGDIRLQSQLVQGAFPDWRQVVPKNPTGSVILDRAVLIGALERVSLLSPDKSGGVRITIQPDEPGATTGHVMVQSTHVGRGQAQQPVDVVDVGDAFPGLEIGMNAHFLLDALKVMDDACAHLSYVNQISPILLRPSSHEGEVDESEFHVVMPMRL